MLPLRGQGRISDSGVASHFLLDFTASEDAVNEKNDGLARGQLLQVAKSIDQRRMKLIITLILRAAVPFVR